MFAELIVGIIFWAAIFLFLIVVGSDLFGIMVDEKIRDLRLIAFYAPVQATVSLPSGPEPLARYAAWALGENRDLVGCVHIRHAGRIRYGKNGRWMNMNGEAFFTLAAPGFVWHTIISYVPGIWLSAFEYYVHDEAGMNLNLFSFLPLDNAHTDEMKESSLFRYLACTPLFPMIHGLSDFITWENVDDSTAKAIIRGKAHSIEALVRFDGRGWIESIEACRKIHPGTGRPVPGHFISRFSGYIDKEGYRIPIQITSDLILPGGEQIHAEYMITGVEFDTPDTRRRSVA